MLLGATVLCALLLLVLLADRLGSRLWEGQADRRFYRCESCDLRYPRRELPTPSVLRCPQGHPVVEERRRTAAGLVGIFACLGFICAAAFLLVAGAGH